MKVRLKVSRVVVVDGKGITQNVDDVVEVGEDEGKRLITKDRAEAIAEPKRTRSKAKPQE